MWSASSLELPCRIKPKLLPSVVFLGGSVVKNLPANAENAGLIPGEGEGYSLQYSCLENPMDREAWWATVHGVTKETPLSG